MKVCCVENCNNKYYSKGFCRKHYEQNRFHGKIIDYEVPIGKYCCVAGCDKHSGNDTILQKDGLMLCSRHYEQYRFCGKIVEYDVPVAKVNDHKCCVPGCGIAAHSTYNEKMYCKKHYGQLYRNGFIAERTIYDGNDFIINDDHAIMICYDKYGNKSAETIVDIDDVERVSKFKWHFKKPNGSNGGYIQRVAKGKEKYLHRFVFGYNGDLLVDHINRNKLDNRKSNLRIATVSQNAMNTKIPSHNKSGVKGVHYDNTRERWVAMLEINGKRKVRYCKTKEEAIQKRRELEIEFFGEYSPLAMEV